MNLEIRLTQFPKAQSCTIQSPLALFVVPVLGCLHVGIELRQLSGVSGPTLSKRVLHVEFQPGFAVM